MAEQKKPSRDDTMLKQYRAIEARLYGELMKTCRRYSAQLNIISVIGILDIVKEEIKELEKTNRRLMKKQIPKTESETIETIH